MLYRNNLESKYPGLLHEGLTVRCQDGEKLGKISAMDDDAFTVQKGFFFPEDFLFRYDDIAEVRGDELILGACGKDLNEWKDPSYYGWSKIEDINEGRLEPTLKDEYKDTYKDRFAGTTTIPLREEELEASKTYKEKGRTRIHKLVHTELKHFTVPVMKEEVKIERVAGGEAPLAGETMEGGAFEEKTVEIPVMEEEVTVSKKPVVKETLKVTKERREEARNVSGEVRREEAEIEGLAEEPKRKAG